MEIDQYTPFWEKAEPLMKAKLEQLKQCLQDNWFADHSELTLSDITEGGDEEFRVTLVLTRGDVTVLGIDFILLDAVVNGGDDEGVGVKLDLVGYGGLALGAYAPHNYTPEAFTTDMDELVQRIEQLDIDEAAAFIVGEALTNPQLKADLAKLD